MLVKLSNLGMFVYLNIATLEIFNILVIADQRFVFPSSVWFIRVWCRSVRVILQVSFCEFTSSQIFYNVIAEWTFWVEHFFRPNTISRVAIIKTTSTKIVFCLLLLSFSSLFLFLLSFSFVTMILKLLRLKKPAFWLLLTQMTANFPRLVFKKLVRHTIA